MSDNRARKAAHCFFYLGLQFLWSNILTAIINGSVYQSGNNFKGLLKYFLLSTGLRATFISMHSANLIAISQTTITESAEAVFSAENTQFFICNAI